MPLITTVSMLLQIIWDMKHVNSFIGGPAAAGAWAFESAKISMMRIHCTLYAN
jgi:hypothetical protein